MTGFKKWLPLAAFAAVLVGCNDQSVTTSSPAEVESPPVLRALERQGLTVHGPLDVPGGLTAFAASSGTQALAVYIMPDSNYAVIGTLLDSSGSPVGEDALRKIVSEPLAQGAWEALQSSNWVQDGNSSAERIVYTFTDPNCPFCNELWHTARPWVEARKLQLRHVMVGVIRADSASKAAAILDADNPQAALTQNELTAADGGIDPASEISPETVKKLSDNVELMRELGFSGTPGMVGRAEDGSLTFHRGVPRGPVLEDLFGPL